MARIGVLALQGAFREHAAALRRLGADVREVRQLKDMEGLEGMVIPGGESTTIGKLLVEWDMLEPLRRRILDGMPVYGSCAGLILLCKEIEGSGQPRLGVLDATVRRNAFGRQVDSFETCTSTVWPAGPCGPCSSARRSSAAWARTCRCWPVWTPTAANASWPCARAMCWPPPSTPN